MSEKSANITRMRTGNAEREIMQNPPGAGCKSVFQLLTAVKDSPVTTALLGDLGSNPDALQTSCWMSLCLSCLAVNWRYLYFPPAQGRTVKIRKQSDAMIMSSYTHVC